MISANYSKARYQTLCVGFSKYFDFLRQRQGPLIIRGISPCPSKSLKPGRSIWVKFQRIPFFRPRIFGAKNGEHLLQRESKPGHVLLTLNYCFTY
jgi:hypothetical protein